MADINIGDILYDVEAEGNIIGWVTGVNPNYHCNYMVTWNDGATIMMRVDVVRDLKKEWYKLRKKVLDEEEEVM